MDWFDYWRVRVLPSLFGSAHRPLRRRWGRPERIIRATAVTIALLAVPLSVATATSTYDAIRETAAEMQANTFPAIAVLLEDAIPKSSSASGPGGVPLNEVPAMATWTTADGVTHEGLVSVDSSLAVGAEVPIWVTSDGKPTPPPKTADWAVMNAAVAGLSRLTWTGLAIVVGYRLAMWLADAVRRVLWGREWDRIEPIWSREHE
jgi:hypothetical protein